MDDDKMKTIMYFDRIIGRVFFIIVILSLFELISIPYEVARMIFHTYLLFMVLFFVIDLILTYLDNR